MNPSHELRTTLRAAIDAAGLTNEEAAAFLLDRLTFGPRPGDIQRVVALGVEAWTEEQLAGALPDPDTARRLEAFPAAAMDAQTITCTYPDLGKLAATARHVHDIIPPRDTPVDLDWRKRVLERFLRDQGQRDQDPDLYGDMVGQKLVRAVYARNQLTELLVDFWFNHFSVSFLNYRARICVLAFERDAIRPRVRGRFGELLHAVARHPAMLLYLDNAQSVSNDRGRTSMHCAFQRLREMLPREEAEARIAEVQKELDAVEQEEEIILQKEYRPRAGINENYARELMELHCMGVDAGYTQADIGEVARALTGWTVYPWGSTPEWFKGCLTESCELAGFHHDGSFLFRADWHDSGEKHILGRTIAAGRGMDEGEEVLRTIAEHPSTARFISRKLATRFVCEAPPAALVDRLASVFTETSGDIRRVMAALVTAPQFWEEARRRAKIRSPFAFVAGALRALGAEITATRELNEWIARLGQPLYRFMAPTGFPDRGSYWINSGTILGRIGFGLNLTAGRIGGVKIEAAAVDTAAAPDYFLERLLPHRDTLRTGAMLETLAHDPGFLGGTNPSNLAGAVIGGPDFQCH